MAFEAGRLDCKVTLLRRDTGHDGMQQIEVLAAVGTRFASRRPLPGGERGEGDGRRSFGRYSLWLRRDTLTASLKAADAVAMDGAVFELTEPPREIDSQRRRGIELLVEGTGKVFAA